MGISDRERKFWEDKGAEQYYEGKSNENPHRESTFVEAGDGLFSLLLGSSPRMERADAYDVGYKSARKGN